MRLNGIGPTTASWIARNWLGAASVAILDIHVIRAGQLIGLFEQEVRLPRDYFGMERRFLDFAEAVGAGHMLFRRADHASLPTGANSRARVSQHLLAVPPASC
ncbi:hypothetical protein [Falsiroseomonas sp. E2-1-a4]|uniref:hypothetical protein n=1 Tax=Falsiroseomonas sp. E2-1-a4 TaxID=3239299 RepID=UPI003F3035DB